MAQIKANVTGYKDVEFVNIRSRDGALEPF